MPDINANSSQKIVLEAGYTLTVLSKNLATGVVRKIGNNLTGYQLTNIAAGQSKKFGPFPTSREYSIEASAADFLTYTIAKPGFSAATEVGNIEGFTGSFALKNEDNGKIFRCDDSANVTITVPNTLMEGFNVGFAQWSTGTITLASDTGATKRAGGAATSSQYQSGSLVVLKNADGASAEYKVGGDFA
jgi:hypothetical protein